MVIEQGAIARRGDGWETTGAVADVQLPDSVHGVIAARLDLLDRGRARCDPPLLGGRPGLLAGRGGRQRARDRRPRAAGARGRAGDVVDGRSARVLVQARPDARRRLRVASAAGTPRPASPGRGLVPGGGARPRRRGRRTGRVPLRRGADARGDEHSRCPHGIGAARKGGRGGSAARVLRPGAASAGAGARVLTGRCVVGRRLGVARQARGDRRRAEPGTRAPRPRALARRQGGRDAAQRCTRRGGPASCGSPDAGKRRSPPPRMPSRRSPAGRTPRSARGRSRDGHSSRCCGASPTRFASPRRRWRSPSEVGDAFATVNSRINLVTIQCDARDSPRRRRLPSPRGRRPSRSARPRRPIVPSRTSSGTTPGYVPRRGRLCQ